jgi:hypothetical protein
VLDLNAAIENDVALGDRAPPDFVIALSLPNEAAAAGN